MQEGFYSNRTDFIRTAISTQLAAHGADVGPELARDTIASLTVLGALA